MANKQGKMVSPALVQPSNNFCWQYKLTATIFIGRSRTYHFAGTLLVQNIAVD